MTCPHTVRLAAFWDTLGWVYFQQGTYPGGKFLNASDASRSTLRWRTTCGAVYLKTAQDPGGRKDAAFCPCPAAPGSAAAACKAQSSSASLISTIRICEPCASLS